MTDNHDARDGEAMGAADHLKRFYAELLDWVEGGCATPSKFSPAYGLCGNLDGWCAHEDDDDIVLDELLEAMGASFYAADLHDVYPFNDWGDPGYKRERTAGAIYANPARLAWIKARAAGAPIAPAALQKEDSSHVG